MSKKENAEKKCIAIHLPVELLNRINEFKAKTGKSQSGLLIDLIEKGLGISNKDKTENNNLYFAKVRIDIGKMTELGQKLQSGKLDTSQIITTYCAKEDPSVGMSFWQAESQDVFEKVFATHKFYYKEVIEVLPVITPMESMKMIMEGIKK